MVQTPPVVANPAGGFVKVFIKWYCCVMGLYVINELIGL